MNKTTINALAAELTKAVIEEIQVYDFTEDEAQDLIYNSQMDKQLLEESFAYVMEIFTEDGDEFAKQYYPSTYTAMMRLVPFLSDNFLSEFNLTHESKALC